MTDILARLAALTEKDDASPVPGCPFCASLDLSKRHDDGRFWWHCDVCGATGPAVSRYSEEDEPCWESRPRESALIELVQEAAAQIELLDDSETHFRIAYERAVGEIERLRHPLGFFASVIKSGEPWTETCQREYDKAIKGQ